MASVSFEIGAVFQVLVEGKHDEKDAAKPHGTQARTEPWKTVEILLQYRIFTRPVSRDEADAAGKAPFSSISVCNRSGLPVRTTSSTCLGLKSRPLNPPLAALRIALSTSVQTQRQSVFRLRYMARGPCPSGDSSIAVGVEGQSHKPVGSIEDEVNCPVRVRSDIADTSEVFGDNLTVDYPVAFNVEQLYFLVL